MFLKNKPYIKRPKLSTFSVPNLIVFFVFFQEHNYNNKNKNNNNNDTFSTST